MRTASFHYLHGNEGNRYPGHGGVADLVGSAIDGRAGRLDLSARSRGGCLRALDLGQATRREAKRSDLRCRPLGTFRADTALRQAHCQGTCQAQRGEAGTSRSASARANANRSPRGTRTLVLPQVSRAGAAVSGFANPDRRGYPYRHHAGDHRTHAPSLLVPALQDHRRANRARRLAWLDDRSSSRGAPPAA